MAINNEVVAQSERLGPMYQKTMVAA